MIFLSNINSCTIYALEYIFYYYNFFSYLVIACCMIYHFHHFIFFYGFFGSQLGNNKISFLKKVYDSIDFKPFQPFLFFGGFQTHYMPIYCNLWFGFGYLVSICFISWFYIFFTILDPLLDIFCYIFEQLFWDCFRDYSIILECPIL